MKNRILFLALLLIFTSTLTAQVAINENGGAPDPSAILDLQSTTKGFLVPRVTSAERNLIGTTQSGLLVYDLSTESFWYYDNSQTTWVEIGAGADTDWTISGNNMYSSVSENVGIGTTNPSSKLQIRNGNLSLISENADAYIKLSSDEEADITPAYIWSENAKGFAVGSTPGTPQLLVNAATGNVGIGTTSPNRKLTIRDGNMSMVSEGSDSYIYLGSNELGDAIGSYIWTDDNVGFSIGSAEDVPQLVVKNSNGNVGIGTTNPNAKLEVAGQVKITDGNPGLGKVLTSDANGLGSWESIPAGVQDLDDLSDAKTDTYSMFLGNQSGNLDDGANYNTGVGVYTLKDNTSGERNLAVGTFALYKNTTGVGNSSLGYASMYNNQTGFSNVAVGVRSLYSGVGNHNIVAVGDSALFNNGFGASLSDDGTDNTAVGSKAMYSNTTGYRNVAFGSRALWGNVSGRYNTALGYNTLPENKTGEFNTAIGNSALSLNEGGEKNIAIGSGSLFLNVNGNNNVALGTNAGYSSTGSGNIFIGYEAGYSETADNKLYIDNSNTTTPLIYGEFDNDILSINGELSVSNNISAAGDINVGDDIVVSGQLSVTESITSSDEFEYASPKTYYLQIPASGFQKKDEAYGNDLKFFWNKYYWDTDQGPDMFSTGHVEAPLNLPDGAVVENIVVYYTMGNAVAESEAFVDVEFRDFELSSNNSNSIDHCTLRAATPSGGVGSFVISNINHTIDNEVTQYIIRTYIWDNCDNNGDSNEPRFYGVRIEYTLDKVTH